MSNYTKNNVRRFITHVDEKDYWDMYLNWDNPGNADSSNDCLSALIDTRNPDCLSGDDLTSLSEYFYGGACSNGLKLENIGYTGVDNGLFHYRKDRISNEEFYKIYTESTFEIESGDTRLHLHKVYGNTSQYDYPTSVNEDGSIKLNGGFYQGFFRSGNDYSVLPSTLEPGEEWNLYFEIRKEDYEPESNNTLNDKYPDNKGIFFYMGTRAENKWIYLYDSLPMSGTVFGQCATDEDEDLGDLIDDEIVLSAQTYDTSAGLSIDSPNDEYFISDNKFLLFDRSRGGITIKDYTGNEVAMIVTKKRKFDGNLFLYMDRTPTGYTVHDIDKLESGFTETYDDRTFYSDIFNNAIAFLVRDDGSIGYRYLIKGCSEASGATIEVLEGLSYPGVVKDALWTSVRVRIVACGNNMMKLMFYVNGKLKYITKELPMFTFRMLDELSEKQEGVAYNISLGGGTQGLAETIMPEYSLYPITVFPLEEHFGGSFIGDIRSFEFHTC